MIQGNYLQFGFEHISSSVFAKGLRSGRQLYGHFHIKKALSHPSRSLENFQQLCCFPRSASACSGREWGQSPWGLQAEEVPHPHPVVRGLCVLGRVEDVGHNPQRNSKNTEQCPRPAEAVPSSPLSAAHPPTSSQGDLSSGGAESLCLLHQEWQRCLQIEVTLAPRRRAPPCSWGKEI